MATNTNNGALVYRAGAVGDDLIASSVAPLLQKKYGWVEWIASKPASAVLENNPYIDRLVAVEPGHFDDLGLGEAWHRWFHKRGKEFAFAVNLSHTCEASFGLQIMMSQFWWPAEARRKLCGGSYLEWVHDVACVPHDFTVGPRFFPTDEEKVSAAISREKIGGEHLIGIALSGSRIDKYWPYLPAFVAKLRREFPDAHIAMFGGNKDMPIAAAIFDFVQLYNGNRKGLFSCISPGPHPEGQVVGSDPEWPIRRALSLLHRCDIVVTPDTGAAWAVAMEPMAKFVLVSHASARNITSHWVNTTTFHADPERVPCHPCHQLHDHISTCVKSKDHEATACMADINDETVLAAVRGALLSFAADRGVATSDNVADICDWDGPTVERRVPRFFVTDGQEESAAE